MLLLPGLNRKGANIKYSQLKCSRILDPETVFDMSRLNKWIGLRKPCLTTKKGLNKVQSSDRSFLSYCDILYIQVKRNIEKEEMYGRDLVLSIDCWLDESRTEWNFAVDCKKGAGFRWTKWLESDIRHQRKVCHFTERSRYIITEKYSILYFYFLNETCMNDWFKISAIRCIEKKNSISCWL